MDELKKIPKRGGLEGLTFNYLTVIEDVGRTSNGTIVYECKCKCGNLTKVNANSLRQLSIKSCGCLLAENARKMFKTHGMSKTRIYKIWLGIVERCTKPGSSSYDRYGGVGIKVSKRWLKFENFYEDMKEGYEAHLTIERINSKKNYYRGNCKWGTYQEQAENRSSVRYITIGGIKKKSLEWAKEVGTPSRIILQRLDRYGWSPKEAVYGKQ